MKQTFDLVSHFFALLPIAVLSSTINKDKSGSGKILLGALIIAVSCSIAYHSVGKTSESYHTLHMIDRFTSSAIMLLTFWLYIDRFQNWITLLVLLVVLVFVILESYFGLAAVAVEGIVLSLVIIAVVIFGLRIKNIGDRLKLKEDFKIYFNRDENRTKIYNLSDPFFLSFFSTQILAIVFFVVDTKPYFHSLWHVFAFISLGSVLIHSLPEDANNTNLYGGCTNEYFVALTYWLGSLPSRLFVSWIFIHMENGEDWPSPSNSTDYSPSPSNSTQNSTGPLGLIFVSLCLIMGFGLWKARDYKMMTLRRKITSVKGTVVYFIIACFLFTQMIGAAGWTLFGDTLVSAAIWVYFKKFNKQELVGSFGTLQKGETPTLKLNNMVF